MTVLLKDILAVLDRPLLDGDPYAPVAGVTLDSRKVQAGWLFVAVPGDNIDGHSFIGAAIRAGATSIMAQIPRDRDYENVNWIQTPDTRRALGPVAAKVYRDPTAELILVGITGTNGKTTLTYLLEAILEHAGKVPGVIGTVSYRRPGKEQSALRTTPEASDLQFLFREMVDNGVTHAVVEVSSHGLHRHRLNGSHFDIGVFTNLSQDHLDYHGNLEDYFLAKQILFSEMLAVSGKNSRHAVVNLDDAYGRRLAQETDAVPVTGFGTNPDSAVKPVDVGLNSEGISGTISISDRVIEIESRLVGGFNLMNILAAIAVSHALGIDLEATVEGVASVHKIPGRLERVPSSSGTVLVDYAHTPDALRTVLTALNAFRNNCTGRIITVMGCGGDRDRAKRPIMGSEAAARSNVLIITSDNPRTEDPLAIIEEVVRGVRPQGLKPYSPMLSDDAEFYHVIPDRREAVAWAVSRMQEHDILLVAGKGHETYQEINGVRYPFDDREILREELARRPDDPGQSRSDPGQNENETNLNQGSGSHR